ARIAVIHGTVATVSDPHEIANVLGIAGIKYMIDNAQTVPLKFYFGAPSCVPATELETSGASLGAAEVEGLLHLKEIKYLAEMMNFPGVLNHNPEVIKKINAAKKYSKPIDGHAPGLRGKELAHYISAGISTDHECLSKEEAEEKIKFGMKILIREGSAARNFEELISLLPEHYSSLMFCSDDQHPDDLINGHINLLIKKALNYGMDLFKVLKVASVNPVFHYGLEVGLLRKGDPADFIVIDNLKEFNILQTYINGELVAEKGKTLIPFIPAKIVNNFKAKKKTLEDFYLPYQKGKINVIEAIDGQLVTNWLKVFPRIENGNVVSEPENDILKLAVVNRYQAAKVALGFIKNFGLKRGAIASSVAHDSHNIVAVGVRDEDICDAVNLIIENQGGICTVAGDQKILLPLPIAGLMSNESYPEVARKYTAANQMAKELGSSLKSPFMTLSFMSLPVIPKLKLCDRGLFDSEQFKFIDVFKE
ncbi:MAG: adenine deaminase, partial [Desulfobacterota bacterium]|nr:adenine deaminase [Thermodesulfobacteriota bacterium]